MNGEDPATARLFGKVPKRRPPPPRREPTPPPADPEPEGEEDGEEEEGGRVVEEGVDEGGEQGGGEAEASAGQPQGGAQSFGQAQSSYGEDEYDLDADLDVIAECQALIRVGERTPDDYGYTTEQIALLLRPNANPYEVMAAARIMRKTNEVRDRRAYGDLATSSMDIVIRAAGVGAYAIGTKTYPRIGAPLLYSDTGERLSISVMSNDPARLAMHRAGGRFFAALADHPFLLILFTMCIGIFQIDQQNRANPVREDHLKSILEAPQTGRPTAVPFPPAPTQGGKVEEMDI